MCKSVHLYHESEIHSHTYSITKGLHINEINLFQAILDPLSLHHLNKLKLCFEQGTAVLVIRQLEHPEFCLNSFSVELLNNKNYMKNILSLNHVFGGYSL